MQALKTSKMSEWPKRNKGRVCKDRVVSGDDASETTYQNEDSMGSGREGRQATLVAAAQMTSTLDKYHNMAICDRMARRAAHRGALMLFLPECCDFIGSSAAESSFHAEDLDGELMKAFSKIARETGLWLSLGGIHERGPNWKIDKRYYNSHVILNSDGQLVSVYRKLHLFDADLPGGESLRESEFTLPGKSITDPVSTPLGKVGLAVCYDLRFPHLSWKLREMGAEILTFPAAFSTTTGPAHWEVLLRARAIETQCWVVGAAQIGRHNPCRASYGDALIADPWGRVIARCGDGDDICIAELRPETLHRVRRGMLVLQHQRKDIDS
uniref:Deaminated glutathione amidase n=2 Tax=Eptatretus burgeri TaxID=7764 RepID=A0A8C4R9T6_EPTBU